MPLIMIKSDPRAREKPCLRCGYSLRKIDATHCPECGLSVWLSLNNNDGLDSSRPEWLRRMATALWAMAAAQLLALFPFAMSTLYWLELVKPTNTFWIAFTVASLCAGLYLIAYHAALFVLTQPERRYPDRLKSWRIAAWVGSGFAGLIALGMLGSSISPVTFFLWHLPLLAVLIASGIVTLGHLRHLARRIPNSRLARICAILMFLPVIPLLKAFPFIGAFLIFQIFHWVIEFIPVLYLPVSAILFIRFAILFRRAAAHAEEHWRAETAASSEAA
jgi:hypothetical protein